MRFDPTVLKLDELREAVEDCGFDVLDASSSDAPPSAPTAPTPPVTPSPTPSELPPAEIDFGSPRIITLAISGMSCRRCVDWVTQALRSVEGVSDATVDLSKHVATVEGVAGAAALVRRVSDTGYTARVIRSNKMTARGSTPTRVLDLEAEGLAQRGRGRAQQQHLRPPLVGERQPRKRRAPAGGVGRQ